MPRHHWDDPDDRIANLLLQFRFIPHDEAPESCRWAIDTDRDEIGANYEQAERPFREEIENYIRSISTEEPLPELSPGAEYFLGVRASVLQAFITSLNITHCSPIRTVFLHPPDVTYTKSVQWLLIDWWNTFGPMEATKARIVDFYYDETLIPH